MNASWRDAHSHRCFKAPASASPVTLRGASARCGDAAPIGTGAFASPAWCTELAGHESSWHFDDFNGRGWRR